jgi:putative Mn2+ efflux pump MntP
MAVATSIDALAVGIMFAFLPDVNIGFAVGSIGVITFVLSAVGVKIGSVFGAKYKFLAELLGGATLVGMGIKILVEHLFF